MEHFSLHPYVEDSYSRKLDNRVAAQEMPYGYDTSPPPYWHENYEAIEAQRAQESHYRPYKEA